MNLSEQEKKLAQIERHCKELAREKRYDEIFETYGKEKYYKYVSKNERLKDAEKLYNRGDWLLLYEKHYDLYEKYLPKMREIDIMKETGSKPKGVLERLKYFIKIKIAPFFLSTLLLPGRINVTFSIMRFLNKYSHYTESNEYTKYLEEYTEKIRKLNLSNIDLIVQLFYDQNKQIWEDGYRATNDIEYIWGNWDIAFFEGEGEVCRDIAGDFANKLRILMPECNPRNVFVARSDDGEFSPFNTSYKIINDINGAIGRISGNHIVTAIDINGITLILDPTWQAIGILTKSGETVFISSYYSMEKIKDFQRPILQMAFGRPEEIASSINAYVQGYMIDFDEEREKYEDTLAKFGQERFQEAYQAACDRDQKEQNGGYREKVVPQVKVEATAIQQNGVNGNTINKDNSGEVFR